MILYILFIVLLIAVMVIVLVSKKKNTNGIKVQEVEEVTLELVISFFKKEEITKLLEEKDDNLPVCLCDKEAENYLISCCVFDKQTSKASPLIRYKTSKIDQDLQDAFGDKNMIILQ